MGTIICLLLYIFIVLCTFDISLLHNFAPCFKMVYRESALLEVHLLTCAFPFSASFSTKHCKMLTAPQPSS